VNVTARIREASTPFDHVSDAMRDDPSLAGSGPGQYQNWPRTVSTACLCCGLRDRKLIISAREFTADEFERKESAEICSLSIEMAAGEAIDRNSDCLGEAPKLDRRGACPTQGDFKMGTSVGAGNLTSRGAAAK